MINKYLKIGILVTLGITSVAAPAQAQEVGVNSFNPQELLRNALQWIDNLGAIAPIAFILIYIIATVAFLPGSILTLGAGVVFGIIQGSILCLHRGNYWGNFGFFSRTLPSPWLDF